MKNREVVFTDDEVAEVLRMNPRTLQKIVAGFVRGGRGAGKRTYGKYVDLGKAEPFSVGGFRRWGARKLAEALGIDVNDLYGRFGK